MPNITARQAAARWSVSDSLARRILANVNAVDRDLETGAKLYNQDAADAAYNSRPGRGTRNDLTADVMPDEQVDRLLADDSIPAEHRALWSLLRDGHARIGDVLSMDVRDVDPHGGVARLDHPKLETDPRLVPISDRTAKLVREAAAGRDSGPLIAGDRERPVTREAAARFARAAANASIHSFRPQPKPVKATRIQVKAEDVQTQAGDSIVRRDRIVWVSSVEREVVTPELTVFHFNAGMGDEWYVSAAAGDVLTVVRQEDVEPEGN